MCKLRVVSPALKVCDFIARADPCRITRSMKFEFLTLLFYAFCLILFSVLLFLIKFPIFLLFFFYILFYLSVVTLNFDMCP